MAAYAATVTPATPYVMKFLELMGLGILIGKINITNYNSALVEVAGITGRFRGPVTVVCSGVSNGAVKQLVRWDETGKAFRCYVPTTGAETANDVNVGEVHFIAVARV